MSGLVEVEMSSFGVCSPERGEWTRPGEEMLTLSQRDRDRLGVLRTVQEGRLTARRGAELVGVSERHFRRMRRAFEANADASVIHGLRGRGSNRRKPAKVRSRALDRAREPLFHDFGPTLLAEHLSRDPEIGPLSPFTLRGWMIAEGLWRVEPRGVRHRKARPRRPCVGELAQMDTSIHDWLEGRGEDCVLIALADDATNRIPLARFVPSDTGAANRQLIIDYLERFGRPRAFYVDRASHFGNARRSTPASIPLWQREAVETDSIIRRALRTLDIELIQARSPQAKGRIERDFGTLQDRLIKEMRLLGIDSIDRANAFLHDHFIPFWNARFAVEPSDPFNAHRPLAEDVDLARLFARTRLRVVAADFTIRYRRRKLQILTPQGLRPKQKIVVEERLDGSVHFRRGERYLLVRPAIEATPQSSSPPPRRQPPNKPAPDHPWRRSNMLFAVDHDPTPAAPRPARPSPTAPGGGHF